MVSRVVPLTKKMGWVLLLLGIYLASETVTAWFYPRVRESDDIRYYQWDLHTSWRLKPDIHVKINGRPVNTNSIGLRGTQEYVPRPDHALRILVLGDSRSYGMAVEDNFTYSSRMQTALRERGIDAEVMNAGTPGYSVVQCRAKLEELLDYRPDIAILAAGYNDRRYEILSPPDSDNTFWKTAFARKIALILQWSPMLYSVTHELGTRKLHQILSDPPPLNQVSVRVDPDSFRKEIGRFLRICQEHQIQPVFFEIEQNPLVFETMEEAWQWLQQGKLHPTLELLERTESTIANAALAFHHSLLGECCRELGDEAGAADYFSRHEPTGSLHGEAILRSQKTYFDILEESAQKENVPLINNRELILRVNDFLSNADLSHDLDQVEKEQWPMVDGRIPKPRQNGTVTDLDDFFAARFVDECHYDRAGQILMGLGLADEIGKMNHSTERSQKPAR